MSQISLCSVCSGMAVIAVLKDPFGKSDEMVNYCATHAPPVQWPHASIVAAFVATKSRTARPANAMRQP